MSIFRRLLSKPPALNAATANIDKMVYLLDYRAHYASIFDGVGTPTPAALAELFLFRAWTVQFGYRIFSSDHAASDQLLGETLNAARVLGLPCFGKVHGVNVEQVLGGDFMSLVEDRWGTYDDRVISHAEESIPARPVVRALTERLGITDAVLSYKLSVDFMLQLDDVKQTALRLGLLK